MLALTENAADVIRRLTEVPSAEGVRISTDEGLADGAEPGLRIEVVAAPGEGDAVMEAEGAHLYLEPTAAQLLDRKVLDADIEGESVRFAVFEQPPENGS